MKIKIHTKNFKAYLSRFRRRMNRAIPKALNKSGEKTVQTIVERSASGRGLRGTFKRYSNEYRDYRSKAGRGSTPDLNFSGRMLSNLGVQRKSNRAVKVGFSRQQEKTKAIHNQKTRPFMGLTNDEVRQVTRAFKTQFERDIK
tara:strand:+ start:3175 stop:3603 length:429 start_codon:yes stop_codon:yes gene_type:complete